MVETWARQFNNGSTMATMTYAIAFQALVRIQLPLVCGA
jgi:hypothetical protein